LSSYWRTSKVFSVKHDSSVTQIENVNIGHNAESAEDTVALPNIIDIVKVIAVDMLSACDDFYSVDTQ